MYLQACSARGLARSQVRAQQLSGEGGEGDAVAIVIGEEANLEMEQATLCAHRKADVQPTCRDQPSQGFESIPEKVIGRQIRRIRERQGERAKVCYCVVHSPIPECILELR